MGSYKTMLVFADIFTDDEVLSDAFAYFFEEGDVIMKVKSHMTTKENANVDVGCGNAFGEGEQDNGPDPDEERVNKKEFMAYMKNYLKKIVENMKSNGKTDD